MSKVILVVMIVVLMAIPISAQAKNGCPVGQVPARSGYSGQKVCIQESRIKDKCPAGQVWGLTDKDYLRYGCHRK